MDRETDKWTDGRTDPHTEIGGRLFVEEHLVYPVSCGSSKDQATDGLTDGPTDGPTDGLTDGPTDGLMVRQMDGYPFLSR